MIFEGMRVGVLPGDFTISADESGAADARLILSTAYNVLPIWLRIASDNLKAAKNASDSIGQKWGLDEGANRELLIAELEASLQVFVACGIALDALYDQLRPYAKISEEELERWRKNQTSRAAQIAEVARRVFRLNNELSTAFKRNISGIIKMRDDAVHPSLKLRNACTRPDIPVGVDWKFVAYRYSNSRTCFESTMQMLIYLYENKCGEPCVDEQLENVFKALLELGVVQLTSPAATSNSPIRGQVKFPHLRRRDGWMVTRCRRASQLAPRLRAVASSCPRTSADARGASAGRAAVSR